MTQPLLTPPPVQVEESRPVRPGRSQKDIATFVSRPKTDSQPEVPAKRSLVIVVGFAVGVLFVGLVLTISAGAGIAALAMFYS